MERLRDMSLKRALFLLSAGCVTLSLLLVGALFWLCEAVEKDIPTGGILYTVGGGFTMAPPPTPEQQRLLTALSWGKLTSCVLFPLAGLALAGVLFYRLKLKTPIALLGEGVRRIRAHDLDFVIPQTSHDELGELCGAFETMRGELLRTNRELWRRSEERKRLNAAFAHDLRNPITVLKGSVKLLSQGRGDQATLERLEAYTARIEEYVEAMSTIQGLEQLPLKGQTVSGAALGRELEETARVLASGLRAEVSVTVAGELWLDHGVFLTVAENLIGNAARFARQEIGIELGAEGEILSLRIRDDGPGFPERLLRDGPEPFGKTEEAGAHFGLGLYNCRLLCAKHGGALKLFNDAGAVALATFSTRA